MRHACRRANRHTSATLACCEGMHRQEDMGQPSAGECSGRDAHRPTRWMYSLGSSGGSYCRQEACKVREPSGNAMQCYFYRSEGVQICRQCIFDSAYVCAHTPGSARTWMIQSTAGMSRPRAATSVQSRMPLSACRDPQVHTAVRNRTKASHPSSALSGSAHTLAPSWPCLMVAHCGGYQPPFQPGRTRRRSWCAWPASACRGWP